MRGGISIVIIASSAILIMVQNVMTDSASSRDRFDYAYYNCSEEMNMTEDELKDMVKYANGVKIADDPRIKCFFKCLLEVFGLIDKYGNGNPNMEFIGVSIKEEKKEEVEKCFGSEKSDPCDKGYYVWTCMNELAVQSMQRS